MAISDEKVITLGNLKDYHNKDKAFRNVEIGSSSVSASTSETITLVAGTNINLSIDGSTVTITNNSEVISDTEPIQSSGAHWLQER